MLTKIMMNKQWKKIGKVLKKIIGKFIGQKPTKENIGGIPRLGKVFGFHLQGITTLYDGLQNKIYGISTKKIQNRVFG